jgi:hypothetical protein
MGTASVTRREKELDLVPEGNTPAPPGPYYTFLDYEGLMDVGSSRVPAERLHDIAGVARLLRLAMLGLTVTDELVEDEELLGYLVEALAHFTRAAADNAVAVQAAGAGGAA